MGHEINEVIKSIDFIFTKGVKSKLSETFFKSVSKESKVVSQYLGIESDIQSTLWSVVFSMTVQKNSSIDLDDFSSYFNTSVLRVFLYQKEFDELIKKKLLQKTKPSRRRRNNESLNYTNLFVPNDLIYSVISGEPLPNRRKSDLNLYEILDEVYSLFQQKDDFFIDTEELLSSIVELLSENKNLPFVRTILNQKLPNLELVIYLFQLQQFTEGNESTDLIRLTRILVNDTQKQLNIRKEFIRESTKLQKLNLVTLGSDSSFKSDRTIVLTSKSQDLFGEDKKFFIEQEISKTSDIILSSSIIEKRLFFNQKEQTSLDYITDMLRPDNYNSVVNRMKDLGMKPGFIVLFHGDPGVGKTESVFQISRITGRDIKRVEISETKSKWYGDTEKIIKRIFTSYEKLRTNSDIHPLLLMNEVDGILKKRQDGNTEISNIESTVVTILLQSFEEFEGILFLTSNNINWDRSFDRRILFKTKFSRPDSETQDKIWKDKLPVLTEKQTQYLSERFDFSGGQIDNISKKVVMTQILTGNIPDLREIEQYCQSETLETKNQRNPIGFRIGSVSK